MSRKTRGVTTRTEPAGDRIMIAIGKPQRKWAKVAGAVYLFGSIPAIFAEFYVNGRLVVPDSAAETARNIIAHEQLFRLGTASNLIVFSLDVALITALYVVLERVSRDLALLALFFRLLETAFLAIAAFTDLNVLRILSGAAYLNAFEPDRLQSLARLSIAAHTDAYRIGLLFFGFGSTVFGYLWLKSGYIPRALAAWGLIASLLVGACIFAIIAVPGLAQTITVGWYGGPILFFEVTMGVWLLVVGLRPTLTSGER